jgi:hypothetical protein
MDYRQLIFYQRAREVLKLTNEQVKSWPKTTQTWDIA